MSLRMEIYSSRGSGEMEAQSPPKSQPPPLPESAKVLSPVRAAADAAFAERMFERLAASDYVGVLMAAEALLEHQPGSADALDCAQIARSELGKMYEARLGSMDRAPKTIIGPEGLVALSLDFGAGYLLSRVNGTATLADIVRTCGLPKLEALRSLSELFLRRAIGFDD